MTAPYKWVIDKDHFADEDAPAGTNANAVGVCGPYNCTDEDIDLPDQFRMFCDDGDLVYEGRTNALTVSQDRSSPVCGFEPLEDFGEPNAGCTSIDYLIDGEWQTL